MGLIAVAVSFLRSPEPEQVKKLNMEIEEEYGGANAETCLVTRNEGTICYTVCNRNEGRFIAGIGGLFIGMISTGLGELNGYFLLQRCRVPGAISVGTSVLVVALTALAASAGHFYKFAQAGGETLQTVLNLVIFTVPGVIIGGQLGSMLAGKIPQKMFERSLGLLFILVALLMLGGIVL